MLRSRWFLPLTIGTLLALACGTIALAMPRVDPPIEPCAREAIKHSNNCLELCKQMPRRNRYACRMDCISQNERQLDWCGLK